MGSVSSGHTQVAFWESFRKTLVEIDWKERDGHINPLTAAFIALSPLSLPRHLSNISCRGSASTRLIAIVSSAPPQRKRPDGRKPSQPTTSL